jgi:DNA modification methylase
LIACEKTGRQARLVELDPKYVDVIARRFQNYAGKPAMRRSPEPVHRSRAIPP